RRPVAAGRRGEPPRGPLPASIRRAGRGHRGGYRRPRGGRRAAVQRQRRPAGDRARALGTTDLGDARAVGRLKPSGDHIEWARQTGARMSQPQPRHAAPNPDRSIKAVRTVRFWALPIVVTLALMSALCALYLGGILNPMTNLRHFPVAVVNEDAGP